MIPSSVMILTITAEDDVVTPGDQPMGTVVGIDIKCVSTSTIFMVRLTSEDFQIHSQSGKIR
jgi:hypothetical protein